MKTKEQRFAEMIEQSGKIVLFSGAGMSTESGIPDFRSAGGIYDQLRGQFFSGEEALSASFFRRYPKLFFQNYREKMTFPDAQPNPGHRFFAMLEEKGKDVTVVTQNIDGLHQKAGSRRVYELHGNGTVWKCSVCGSRLDEAEISYDKEGVGRHRGCPAAEDAIIRPDIVLYGEMLDREVTAAALQAIQTADMLVVIGTTLSVYPAASYIDDFQGEHAVLINRDHIAGGRRFELVVQESAGAFLERVWNRYFR